MAGSGKILSGRKALVTGAGSGIGRAIAVALADAGASVAVNDRGSRAGADTVDRIMAAGGEAFAVQADVSREEDVEAMFAAVAERGGLDILVANAGIQRDAPIAEMSLADWRAVIDTNLTGAFLCARAAVREFRRRATPRAERAIGTILFMSSVHEVIPWAYRTNYAASKGGIMLLMKSLAQELAAEKIRVNSIAPGAIRTDINRPAWETPAALDSLLDLIPYGRIGEPDDVAKAAVWLVSDEADYVTGTTLFVDGGFMLRHPSMSDGAEEEALNV